MNFKTIITLINRMRFKRNDIAYYCNALQGDSGYNICINSDMTISCNCQDYDGAGQLGDLTKNTFEGIFFGEIASRFRKELAHGRFPIPLCQNCMELRTSDESIFDRQYEDIKLPHKGIMVENTVLCNYKCINCNRTQLMNIRKKNTMTIADTGIVADILRRNSIKSVCYFNLGEPFLDNEIYQKVAILRNSNPDIEMITSTNGSLINTNNKVLAALMLDHIFVSIDGSDESTMSKYQVGGSFETNYRNIVNLIKARNGLDNKKPVIEWKYVVFAWNDDIDHIERAIDLARSAGFDIISFWRGFGLPEHMSQKFATDPYFLNLGVSSWKGRVIDFRDNKDAV